MENKSMKKQNDDLKTSAGEYLIIFTLFLPHFLLFICGIAITVALIGGIIKLFTIWF